MKRNKRTPAAREYFRAFYEKNHIRYWAAMVLSVLSIGVNLFVTWLLGAMIDIIAAGEADRLLEMLWVWIGLAVFTVTVDTASYWAKLGFVRRALVQYKALAFRRLSEKSISAFSQENTGRYLSTLTNDVTTIESNYLEKPFEMAAYMLTGVGAFMMMIWYSPLLAAAVMVFFGFRTGFFSFQTGIILPFAIGGAATAGAVALLALMALSVPRQDGVKNHRLLFRKRYMPYYMVTLAYGCQKRIKIVFAPWVIINLLGQGADTVALLTIVTYLAGTWAAPYIGKMLDRWGVRRMLLAEAAYIVLSFSVMGLLAGMLAGGAFSPGDWRTWLVYGAYVLCVLFEQFNMVHSYMMRAIALDPSEVTQTLSVGLSVDHVMAIIASPVMGIIWHTWGVQYVFWLAAVSALFQVAAAAMTRETQGAGSAPV